MSEKTSRELFIDFLRSLDNYTESQNPLKDLDGNIEWKMVTNSTIAWMGDVYIFDEDGDLSEVV